MASSKFYPVPSNETQHISALAKETASDEIVIGMDHLVRIVATQDINVKFGQSGLADADSSDLFIPANTAEIFDLSSKYESLSVYNAGDAAGDVWITPITNG